MNEEDPKTISGNQDSTYELPAHESHLVHVSLDPSEFDPRTGKRISEPKVQKFRYQEFLDMQKVDGFSNYKVQVLHDPTAGGSASEIYQDEGLTPEQKEEKKAKKAAKKAKKLLEQQQSEAGWPIHKETISAPVVSVEEVSDSANTEKKEPVSSNEDELGEGDSLAEGWNKGFKKADYQAKYKELYGEDAEESETIEDLTTAIEEFYQKD